MIIYLYGPDAYRRQQEAKRILEEYRNKYSGLTVENFDLAQDGEAARIKDFLVSQSLFNIGGRRLAVISAEEVAEEKEIIPFLKSTMDSEDANVLLTATKKLPKPFDFLCRAPVKSKEFAELPGTAVADFIQKEARRLGVRLTPIMVEALRQHGSDSWAIITDLEVLALGGRVEDAIIAPDFFPLLMRLQKGDLGALTWLLERDEPAKVFNVLAASVKSPAAKAKMADYDVAVKSGKLEYAEALTDLALSLS